MRDGGKSGWSRVLRRVLAGPLIVLGCAWFAGCYQFVRVDPATAPPGARARVELTSQGSGRLAQQLGGDEQVRIEGRIVEASPDGGVVLDVPGESPAPRAGVSSRPLLARVSVPPGDLISLELQRLSKGRTAALVGAGVAAAVVIVKAAFDIGGGGNGEGGGPSPDEILIPFFSIRIGG